MTVVTLILIPHPIPTSGHGISLPSPELWVNHYPATWILNTVLLFACGGTMLFCNKKFNFLQSNGFPMVMALIVLMAGNPYITVHLGTSTLLCLVNITALWTLFNTYRCNNATQYYFLIATSLSLGSMFQYAFVPMILVYPIGGIMLKSLRIKEALAYLMGLVAPYWIGLGLGLLSPADLSIPAIETIFTKGVGSTCHMVMLLASGLFFLFCSLLSLNNAVRLYAGNSKIRHLNNTINVLGYLSFLCILIDYGNMQAYLGTLYLWMAVQIGNLFSLHRMRQPSLVICILAILWISQFVLQLTLMPVS